MAEHLHSTKSRWPIPNRDTLETIYARHRDGLFVLALSITHSRADAEDAIHDAFVRLAKAPDLACNDPVAYVFAAVRNAAIDRHRVRHNGRPMDSAFAACLNGEDHLETRERDQSLAAAIDALCEEHRTVVLLRIYSGLTFRQIGELTDTPLQTIASRYAAALDQLEPLLRKWI